jgi:hypothetical protein
LTHLDDLAKVARSTEQKANFQHNVERRTMHKINRRDALASLGLLGGSALMTGCGGSASSSSIAGTAEADTPMAVATAAHPPAPTSEAHPAAAAVTAAPADWTYVRLDPRVVAEQAYRMYPQGNCMYAVVGSVITELANQVGEPFRSFPFQMMRYGASGLGGWGSLCGVVNGGAALIGLFRNGQQDKEREELLAEFCLWYETTALPTYEPAESQVTDPIDASVAGSVLCHISVDRWCKTNGCEAFSPQRSERCRRLSTDGVLKVVELLNRDAGEPRDFLDISAETHACIECHGRNSRRDALAKMNCVTCHQFDTEHP